jgi:hypothetical protein
MALRRTIHALAVPLCFTASVFSQHQIVCSGKNAGGYTAFPDICGLQHRQLF